MWLTNVRWFASGRFALEQLLGDTCTVGVPTPGRRYFPGLADPERLATFVRRALENDDGDALHALFDVGAPPRWPPPPPPAPLDWDDDDELDSDDEAHFRLHQWLAQIPVH